MTLVLTRIDARLVHGQVVVGWVPHLRVDRILVVDPEIAADDWERDLVVSAAPPGVEIDVRTVPEAQKSLEAGARERILLLVRSPARVLELLREGVPLDSVNLGGLHHRDGARRFLDYLFVTSGDLEALAELDERGIRIVAQDLPGNAAVDVNAALAEGRLAIDQLPPGHS